MHVQPDGGVQILAKIPKGEALCMTWQTRVYGAMVHAPGVSHQHQYAYKKALRLRHVLAKIYNTWGSMYNLANQGLCMFMEDI